MYTNQVIAVALILIVINGIALFQKYFAGIFSKIAMLLVGAILWELLRPRSFQWQKAIGWSHDNKVPKSGAC
jgi:hypothetical protein